MDVVMPLVGVVIGGVLVLLGDSVRRRVEWRRAQVEGLHRAGTEVLALLNRTCGELLEHRERGEDVPLHGGSGARREAASRFFAQPGSDALRSQFNDLLRAHARLRRSAFELTPEWDATLEEYEVALQTFRNELQAILRRGRVPVARGSDLADVMAVASPFRWM
jgi:hypothetical protein